MKRIALMFAMASCLVLMPTSVPVRITFAAPEPRFVWCWSASLKPDVHQMYYSSVFQGDLADGQKMQGAYQKYVLDAYPDSNAGPGRCRFYDDEGGAESSMKTAKAESRFENQQIIETGWSYRH